MRPNHKQEDALLKPIEEDAGPFGDIVDVQVPIFDKTGNSKVRILRN